VINVIIDVLRRPNEKIELNFDTGTAEAVGGTAGKETLKSQRKLGENKSPTLTTAMMPLVCSSRRIVSVCWS